MPIFDEAADEIRKSFTENHTVVLGKLNCENPTEIAKNFNIFSYPNIILFRNGQQSKRRYNGARTLESFLSFIDIEMKDPMIKFQSLNDLDPKKRIIIGYFEGEDNMEYNTFRKVARNLQEECQ